jgi:hypothetical protein
MSNDIDLDQFKADLTRIRLASYVRLTGGYPVPLAGAVYWIALGIAGHFVSLKIWMLSAALGSGLIFPMAILFATIAGNNFLRDSNPLSSALFPAFIGMLLFWPMVFAAGPIAVELTPLMIAIGLSAHWPIIGWIYARTALFTAHALVRAAAVTYIWFMLPDERITTLPFAVAAVYLVTVLAILIDVAILRARRPED